MENNKMLKTKRKKKKPAYQNLRDTAKAVLGINF